MATRTSVTRNAAEKRKEALELRALGYSYQQIADEVGYASRGAAYKAVDTEIKNIPREAAEHARELELGRLDDMQAAAMNLALNGDLFAIDRVVKIVESRSRLLGLYNLPDNSDPGAEQAKKALTDFLAVAAGAVQTLAPLPDADDAPDSSALGGQA